MRTTRKLISINEELCDGCGNCVPGCAEGALQIVDGKAKLVKDIYCDGLGACVGECPQGALKVVEVEAEDFDPDAVKELLKEQGRPIPDHLPTAESLRGAPVDGPKAASGCGCPGSQIRNAAPMTPCQQANIPKMQGQGQSSLSHWPVQLRLVPPQAPFLKDADILLTADCVPVAFANYQKILAGKISLLGCPKFDDQMSYVEKLAAILNENDIKSITIMEMEVPCCSSMSQILNEAYKRAGKVPTTRIIIGLDGSVKSKEQI